MLTADFRISENASVAVFILLLQTDNTYQMSYFKLNSSEFYEQINIKVYIIKHFDRL